MAGQTRDDSVALQRTVFDTIIGGQGDDFLYGGLQDDTFIGGAGSDFYHGGDLFRDQTTDGKDIVNHRFWGSTTSNPAAVVNTLPVTVVLGGPEAHGTGVNQFGWDHIHNVVTVDDAQIPRYHWRCD